MDTTTIVDMIKSTEVGHNLSQSRGLEKLWKEFGNSSKKMVRDNFKKYQDDPINVEKPILTEDVTLANIDLATECFSFKTVQDMLDLELIHFATIGRDRGNSLEKVFCFTADPIEKARVRIQMMKSFVLQTKEMFKEYGNEFEPKNGIIGFFDLEGSLKTHIDVSDEPRLFERIHNEKILI